ncbi:hypothetical protein GEMRC1_011814 [Eukaryota sp. GEM-RC1]
MFNDEVPPLEGTFTILDDQRRPHSILMDPSEPESLIPIRKCWEIVQDVRTAHLFTKNHHSNPITSLSSKDTESSTTAFADVVIQPTALKHRARVEHEAELARRAQSNPIPKMKEVSEPSFPADQPFPNPQHDVLSIRDLTGTLSSSSISNSSGIPSPMAVSASNPIEESPEPLSHSVVTFQQKFPVDSLKNSKMQPKMLENLKPESLIDFVTDYHQWSLMDPNHKAPIGAPFGWPRHFFDLVRTAAQSADPSYVQRFVKFNIQTQLSMSREWNGTTPLQLWIALLRRTQYTDVTVALNELNKIKMKWSINDPEERWGDYINRLHRVLQRTQAILPKNEKVMTALSDKAIIKAIMANLGIVSIWLELWPAYQDSNDIQMLFYQVKQQYDNWCDRWKSSAASVQNEQRIAEIANLRGTATWEELPKSWTSRPLIPVQSEPGKPRRTSSSVKPMKKSRSEEKDPNACRFCGEKGHSILQCPDPECKRSELPLDQRNAKSTASKPSRSHILVVYPDQRKPRLTGDFSGSDGINALTRVVEPNLPKIIDILEFLSEANFIATLDIPKAFWQLNLAEKDRDKTTLVIPGKAIRFKKACFGLKNVPAIFQNLMYEIFDHEGIFIYIDDIIIVGRTFQEFMDRLRFVLTKAFTRRVNLGLPKCNFVTKRHPLKILGSKFVNNTRSIDPLRITALLELPVPTTIKEVRSFVGSINYSNWFN